ncbi:MAG TPA: hypothetical protein VG754_00035 [Verrucomicrobiae bacterium]|jgi:hypothetical protein|nr:hypothetical protein [Verrucomicrobiae bacterium]
MKYVEENAKWGIQPTEAGRNACEKDVRKIFVNIIFMRPSIWFPVGHD